jgi:hypothetical protein
MSRIGLALTQARLGATARGRRWSAGYSPRRGPAPGTKIFAPDRSSGRGVGRRRRIREGCHSGKNRLHALSGAFFGYLALFGPLVLLPQVLPGSAVRIGSLLTALPVGFSAAAVGSEAVLPRGLSNRQRGAVGALICALALAMLIFVQASDALIAALLALAGVSLGIFGQANNAVIMRSSQAGSASVLGGLVNMARGIGTTFGIALVSSPCTLPRPVAAAGRIQRWRWQSCPPPE